MHGAVTGLCVVAHRGYTRVKSDGIFHPFFSQCSPQYIIHENAFFPNREKA
jgi:hypothetical protein